MINITQRDAVTLTLRCPDHDLTAATLTTSFLNEDGTRLEIANGSHTISNQTTNTGEFTVPLTAAQTLLLKLGTSKVVTKVVQGSVVRQFHGDVIRVRATPFTS